MSVSTVTVLLRSGWVVLSLLVSIKQHQLVQDPPILLVCGSEIVWAASAAASFHALTSQLI